ncbi:MAG: 16S rRNA (cytosine(1402)-N(4))-methyltransferase RsmH [Desulfobacterales bacterium]|nr:16S rRNA (cytosine(1402)-N(4))-methyltransferase RsmH [Desulfobacterales bacterium]
MIIAHQPVMVDEVIAYLVTTPEGIYVDGTVGTGGHSLEICKRIAPKGRLICLDIDSASLQLARKRLALFGDRVKIIKESYAELDKVLKGIGVERVNGIFLDLGMSSYQLESSGRGFSFMKDEPLDMRMDQERTGTASRLVNTISMERLRGLLWDYAEERWAKLIARAVVEERRKAPISSSLRLARLVETTIPRRHHPRKRHPATKTFQAIRIAVNRELQNIAEFLEKAPLLLVNGGRLAVISYHSLEDRLVKQAFRRWEREEGTRPPLMRALEKKGLKPSQAEMDRNPRSRSAIMRVAERD